MEFTYLAFLVVFVLVPLAVLGVVSVRSPNAYRPPIGLRAVGTATMVALALAYTTPWDNLLIAQGVWWYGEGRVVARVWLAPIEEYMFILLQSILVATWTFRVAGPVESSVEQSWWDAGAGAVAGLAVGAAGVVLLLGPQSGLYLGAILTWASPVLALQWAVGWRYIVWARRRIAVAIGVPTAYLCAADWFAIRNGIWTISADKTTGLALAGLPVEEAVFFLLTSTFLAQGLVLLRWVIARFR